MYTQHWGLTKSPFTGSPRGSLFYATSGQSEALARIDYLLKNGRRCGVVTGDVGLGKSTVFEQIGQRESRLGSTVVSMSLLGMSESEFVTTLAQKLGMHSPNVDSPAAVWRGIFDRLTTNQYQQTATILLFDDAQDADPSVLTAIARLSQWNPGHETKVTILLATPLEDMSKLGSRLLDLCDLKIALRTWRLDDTVGYVRSVMEQTGGSATAFSNRALETLQELSAGSPRNIRRLAELALIAGAAQRLRQIDADTLLAVDSELRMTPAAA